MEHKGIKAVISAALAAFAAYFGAVAVPVIVLLSVIPLSGNELFKFVTAPFSAEPVFDSLP